MGSRTTSPERQWTHLCVRRLIDYLKRQLELDTRWAAFEPNGHVLRRRLVQTVDRRMRRLFDAGALAGRTPAEAWFVRCDEEVNTTADVDAGRVIVLLGAAPAAPSEFIVFRLVHMSDGMSLVGEV